MKKKTAKDIYEDYLMGRCTPEEKALVERTFANLRQSNTASYSDEQHAQWARKSLENILDEVQKRKMSSVYKLYKYAAIAVLLIVISITLYVHQGKSIVNLSSEIVNQNNIAPGGNRATLTLVNGTKVELDSLQSRIIVSGKDIKYNDGNSVLIEKGKNPGSSKNAMHQRFVDANEDNQNNFLTLTTPRGGQYQIILEDGTKVWLNAASTLKYPIKFMGDKREVQLEGEAYFSVNKHPSIGSRIDNPPFIVKSRHQNITVLGTEFNISSYVDDPFEKTTLIDGAVQVSTFTKSSNRAAMNQRLKPSQQAINANGEVQVKTVDEKTQIAWKSGKFYFKNTPFRDMIMQVSRWYDIDVVYKSNVPKGTFSGDMKRSAGLITILELLKLSDIRFYVEGRKLIIE